MTGPFSPTMYPGLAKDRSGNTAFIGSVLDKGGVVFNIRHPTYGAVGDGVTDDAPAIQAAINDAIRIGGRARVVLPASDAPYVIASTIVVASSHVIIEGVNREQSQMRYTGTGDAITIAGTVGNEILYTGFKSFRLLGQTGASRGIVATLAARFFFDDIYISGFDSHGIDIRNGWAPSFNHCRVDSCGGDGIHLEAGANHQMHHAVVIDSLVTGCDRGFFLQINSNGAGAALIASTFQACTDAGIVLDGGNSHLIDKCYMEENTVADVRVGGSFLAKNVTVISSYFLTTAGEDQGTGVELQDDGFGAVMLLNCWMLDKATGISIGTIAGAGTGGVSVSRTTFSSVATEVTFGGRTLIIGAGDLRIVNDITEIASHRTIESDELRETRLRVANAGATHRHVVVFQKARGTLASPALVVSNDDLGSITWSGHDGNGYQTVAEIISEVDGVASAGDIPSRIVFLTSADGGTTRAVAAQIRQNKEFQTIGPIAPQNTAAKIYSASGSPEGAVTAAIGSLFLRTDGGSATSLYVKEAGAGNTGWAAK